jgi:hypothetical protein
MRSFAEQVGENTRYLRERYMDPQNVLKFSHGHSWEAPANELGDKKGTIQQHGTETEIRLSDIAEGRAHVIFDAVNQVTQDMHDQMERMMFETMKAATDRTGQVVHAAGRPMPETMYEMLENMELSLGKDGELSMPSMFIHPSQTPKIMAELDKAGHEFKQRFELLKAKKKEAARIKEQERLARFERL